MVKLILTKMDLQVLIVAMCREKESSEEVGVPLEGLELDLMRKLYVARDRAYPRHSPEATEEWKASLARAPVPLSERRRVQSPPR